MTMKQTHKHNNHKLILMSQYLLIHTTLFYQNKTQCYHRLPVNNIYKS
jgi:hypothetical protein